MRDTPIIPATDDPPLEVVVVGGGVAGLETVMALRAAAGRRVHVKLLTPEKEFVYRPLAVGEPFDLGAPSRHEIGAIAADFEAELVRDTLDWVAPGAQRVFTGSGSEIPYDALVIAMGARPTPVWDRVVTFTGSREAEAVRSIVHEVERGAIDSVAFVIPTGTTWPLPIYELALLTARRAAAAGKHPELAIYTPEKEPLAVFGNDASRRVASELALAGVRVARSAPAEVTADGDLVLPHGATPPRYARMISLPRLQGPAPRGIPHDEEGFIPIDSHGTVAGVTHVHAAGDGTDYPIKHGGIAAQQADAVADVIAKRAGAAVDPRPFHPTIRGQLLTGGDPQFLRADLDPRSTELSEASTTPMWWPPTKIAGTHLAPYLAARAPVESAVPASASPELPEERRIVFLPGDSERSA